MTSYDDPVDDKCLKVDSDGEFLLREGFDLLAAFRCIKNEDIRRSLLAMIVTIASAGQTDNSLGKPPKPLDGRSD